MAYVAVSGGQEAIEKSIELLNFFRSKTDKNLDLEAIEKKLNLLIDRVMSEAGFYTSTYAALALKQCEGSVEEAVFLLRAYRSTLNRNYYSLPVNTNKMRVIRRISAAFKDIQGGQILGATYDYTHRLMNFDLDKESSENIYQQMCIVLGQEKPLPVTPCERVSTQLKKEGLIDQHSENNEKPCDITKNILEFPCKRSARLQTLSRADTGFISGLAYSALRGFGQVHPTVGELRTGYVSLEIPYLFDDKEAIDLGEILISEVECFNETSEGHQLKIGVGYGAVFGRNENKAIAMAILDRELENKGANPPQNEEFVLTHGDSLEMNGFISHLKLPHYVTFQSKLDAIRKTRNPNSHESQL